MTSSQPARSVCQPVAQECHGDMQARNKSVPLHMSCTTMTRSSQQLTAAGLLLLHEVAWKLGPYGAAFRKGRCARPAGCSVAAATSGGVQIAEGTHLDGQSERAVDGCPPARRQDRNPSCCAVTSHGVVGMIRI